MKELELKIKGIIPRLTNETFKFDSRIKSGWYTAVYFLKTTEIARKEKPDNIVTMQFFQRGENSILCGIDEAIALIHTFADNPQDLKIEALHDGDIISPLEPILKITGPYQSFGFLEGVIDGILARRSSVATNVYNVVKAATPKKILFMGDRDDYYSNQQGDGYAAYIGGIAAQCTHAMNEWWGKDGGGTMPHALIQLFEGDIVKAAEAYLKVFPEEKLTVLVDYHNNVIEDSLKVAHAFKENLVAVRVDTSKALIDHYFDDKDISKYDIDVHGVNPILIKALREALDKEGFNHVQIIVSSGFDVDKIELFKKYEAPVDVYGIGSSLLQITVHFTGDCVRLNGKPMAKEGRKELFSDRLEIVEYQKQM